MEQRRRLHLEILADESYKTMSDEDLRWYGYAARYAEYSRQQIEAAGMTPEQYAQRNYELLARLEAIEKKQAEAAAAQRQPQRKAFAPTGTTPADTSRGTGRCARCGADGHWNPGAGQYLCARHWDEY